MDFESNGAPPNFNGVLVQATVKGPFGPRPRQIPVTEVAMTDT
jgi:hypothetical protein